MPSFTVGPVMSTDDALDFSPKSFTIKLLLDSIKN